MVLSAGSGTPFSKQSNITQEAASGINDRSTLEGKSKWLKVTLAI